MKLTARLLGFLFFVCPVFAQTTATTNAPHQTTIVGCLNRGASNYTLIDSFGRTYDLTGDNSLLAPYEGAEVEIAGTFSNVNASEPSSSSTPQSGSLASSTIAGTANTSAGTSEQGHGSFNVIGVTKAADTCSMHN